MSLRIYQNSGGRQFWADSTSPATAQKLSSGEWVLFDDTPDTPPPAPDGFDAAVRDRLNGSGTLTRAAVRALVAADTAAPASAIGAAQRAASVALFASELAANPDVLIAGTITRDANGAATAAPVVWPDGTVGTYTADTVSTAFPGAVDAYHVTYGSPATKTYTQPAVTRDTTGAVTQRPALVVS